MVTGGRERTSAGWELQLATNHLGHFSLASDRELPPRTSHRRSDVETSVIATTSIVAFIGHLQTEAEGAPC
jgi:NAD(P)-dependent dehydrogenase (short-subunit alcohol dehydrogenase family)